MHNEMRMHMRSAARREDMMTSDRPYDSNRAGREASGGRSGSAGGLAGRTASPCKPLEEEIEVLEEQIAVLEEGRLRAPGMERAALAKEIAGYRRQLDARQQALRHCLGT
jgi:hypothetical protein